MSITAEVEKVIKENASNFTPNGSSKLIDDYQDLLDRGIIKQRGYTLQTIEEKQDDILKINSSYSIRKEI